MFEQSLIQLGLTYTQAAVYEVLLKNGPLPAGKIAKKTDFKRGLVYKILEDLVKAGLVQKEEEKGKVAIFEIKHPMELRDFAEKKQQKARDAKVALEGVLPAIISEFNLVSQKPGILFFEGEKGVVEALNDTLKSRTEIYTYSDIYHTNSIGKKINDEYVKKRIKAQINKKVLAPISNKDLFPKKKQPFTEVRFLDDAINPFVTAMQIYDNKISYQTFDQDNMIAVIIEDKNIYSLHKGFFEFVWNNLAIQD